MAKVYIVNAVVLAFVLLMSISAPAAQKEQTMNVKTETTVRAEDFTGATISEQAVKDVLFVDGANPAARDDNPGTAESPLKTIARATARAVEANAKNIGMKIIIAPGAYHESITLEADGHVTDAPLILEAAQPGTVIITGAEVWDGWIKAELPDTYTHPWPYRWGMWPMPEMWEPVDVRPLSRRCEMIFADGQILKQVLASSELIPGSFCVSEEQGTVLLRLPEGMSIEQAKIEVAVLPGMTVSGWRNLVLRGLQITRTCSSATFSSAALGISNSSQVLIEDCQFNWNNTGLAVGNCHDVTLRRVTCNRNGGSGIGAHSLKNIIFEDIETSYNNWRNEWAGDTHHHLSTSGWAIGGIKALLIYDGVFRRHTSIGNYARGFWLDTSCKNILVESACWQDNAFDGVFIESDHEGPITLKGCFIAHNKGVGVLSADSGNVTLDGNTIWGNGEGQLTITGQGGPDFESWDWETDTTRRVPVGGWHLTNNVFVGIGPDQNLLDVSGWNVDGDWAPFMSTFVSDHNLWFNPDKQDAFTYKGKQYDLKGWKKQSKQDSKSVFANPRFKNR